MADPIEKPDQEI